MSFSARGVHVFAGGLTVISQSILQGTNKATMFLVRSHAAKVSLFITKVLLECTSNGQGFCLLWK